jgi:hypothetical protein
MPYCIPTYNQNGPSCVGQGWANWLECMIRKNVSLTAFAKGEQIGGELIWREGRRMFYKNDLSSGLLLNEGFDAMKNLGLIPPGSELVYVPNTWSAIGEALKTTPLVQGHHVHAGWARPSKVNGQIDEQPRPTNADGYHCTLCIGRLRQKSIGFKLNFNSWLPWGWNGVFVMTLAEDAEGIMAGGLFTAKLSQPLSTWQGWKKGIIRK